MHYYLVEMDNDYCGCGQEFIIRSERELSNDEIDATYADTFDDFCNDYCYVAQGFDTDKMEWEDEESEEWYFENCSWCWSELEEDEVENYGCIILDFAN